MPAALLAIAAVIAAIVVLVPRPDGASNTPVYGSQVILPFTGLDRPSQVAVDGTGTVYVTDANNDRVLMLAAGSDAPTELPFTNVLKPSALAVDAAGSVYVGDAGTDGLGGYDRVQKLPAGATAPTELPLPDLGNASAIAIDSVGAVYVADGSLLNRVLKLPKGAAVPIELPFGEIDRPSGLAIDAADNVYLANRVGITFILRPDDPVRKLAPGAAEATTLSFSGRKVAVDGAGAVYVVYMDRQGFERVLKYPDAGSDTPTKLSFDVSRNMTGLAVDADGAVYAVDYDHNRVLKLPFE